MQENILDERFQDIILQGLTDDYDYIRDTHHRDRTFGLEEMKNTMKNMYVDNLSRRDNNRSRIGGRGVAMGTRNLSDIQCHGCKEYGHYRRLCPKNKNLQGKSGGGGKKWCSYHNSTSHNDDEC